MLLTRWQNANPAWNQVHQLQHELNRLVGRWGDGERGNRVAVPAVNVWEDNDALFVEAELPGIKNDDLEIFITDDDLLTLKGRRQQPEVPENSVWHRQERRYDSFVRVLQLPFPVDRDQVDARFANGVLTVKLAKRASAKPRKIIVKSE